MLEALVETVVFGDVSIGANLLYTLGPVEPLITVTVLMVGTNQKAWQMT